MHDGIESEAKGAELLFLSLLERTPDFTAFAVMNAPAEAMAQFRVVVVSNAGEKWPLSVMVYLYRVERRHFSQVGATCWGCV
ncbi:MAG: hypothetical protein PHU07_03980 [Acidocella sp.]|nr:hypothetical protein [Acidocella sp.]